MLGGQMDRVVHSRGRVFWGQRGGQSEEEEEL